MAIELARNKRHRRLLTGCSFVTLLFLFIFNINYLYLNGGSSHLLWSFQPQQQQQPKQST